MSVDVLLVGCVLLHFTQPATHTHLQVHRHHGYDGTEVHKLERPHAQPGHKLGVHVHITEAIVEGKGVVKVSTLEFL